MIELKDSTGLFFLRIRIGTSKKFEVHITKCAKIFYHVLKIVYLENCGTPFLVP